MLCFGVKCLINKTKYIARVRGSSAVVGPKKNAVFDLASAWRLLRVGLGRFGGSPFCVGFIWLPIVVGVAAVPRCFGLVLPDLASA